MKAITRPTWEWAAFVCLEHLSVHDFAVTETAHCQETTVFRVGFGCGKRSIEMTVALLCIWTHGVVVSHPLHPLTSQCLNCPPSKPSQAPSSAFLRPTQKALRRSGPRFFASSRRGQRCGCGLVKGDAHSFKICRLDDVGKLVLVLMCILAFFARTQIPPTFPKKTQGRHLCLVW
eukprot:864008-Amphidinium_carterae.1